MPPSATARATKSKQPADIEMILRAARAQCKTKNECQEVCLVCWHHVYKVLEIAVPELLLRTHWIAPLKPTVEMLEAVAWKELNKENCKWASIYVEATEAAEIYSRMRDNYLGLAIKELAE